MTPRHRDFIRSVGIERRIILKGILEIFSVTIHIYIYKCLCVLESYDTVAALVNKVMIFRASEYLPEIHCATKTIMS